MNSRSIGLVLIVIFLFLSTGMLYLAAFTLIFPGTSLDSIWSINPKGYSQIVPYGQLAGFGFLALSIPMLAAAVGWHKRKKWGWVTAVCIFSANGLGDTIRIFTGEYVEGIIGLVIASLIIFYLTRASVKNNFQ